MLSDKIVKAIDALAEAATEAEITLGMVLLDTSDQDDDKERWFLCGNLLDRNYLTQFIEAGVRNAHDEANTATEHTIAHGRIQAGISPNHTKQ